MWERRSDAGTRPRSVATKSALEVPVEIEVQIRGLMMDPVTNMPIVILKDVESEMVLPIWVGIFEANAIAIELEKTALRRGR